MNEARLRLANALLNNRVRRYKMRQMMMPDAKDGGRMLKLRESVLQRVEGVDELIPEEFRERRSYERTTLPIKRQTPKGEVIIQEEDQALEEAKKKEKALFFGLMDREKRMSGSGVQWYGRKRGGRRGGYTWADRKKHLMLKCMRCRKQ
jgi:hypothetical protein